MPIWVVGYCQSNMIQLHPHIKDETDFFSAELLLSDDYLMLARLEIHVSVSLTTKTMNKFLLSSIR